MKVNNHKLFRLRSVVLALVIAACVAATGLGLRASAWYVLRRGPTRLELVPQEKPKPVPIARELVTIHPWGFEPSNLSRPTGPFVLEVRNASGLRDVSLRLDGEAATRLQEKRMLREKLDWTATLDLPVGTYFLTEEGHKTWFYRIAITERQTR